MDSQFIKLKDCIFRKSDFHSAIICAEYNKKNVLVKITVSVRLSQVTYHFHRNSIADAEQIIENIYSQLTQKEKINMDNNEKIKHELFPFTWKEWDEQGVELYTFYDVEFFEDFGKIKKGNYEACNVDYSFGIIKAINTIEDGSEFIITQKFKAIAVEE